MRLSPPFWGARDLEVDDVGHLLCPDFWAVQCLQIKTVLRLQIHYVDSGRANNSSSWPISPVSNLAATEWGNLCSCEKWADIMVGTRAYSRATIYFTFKMNSQATRDCSCLLLSPPFWWDWTASMGMHAKLRLFITTKYYYKSWLLVIHRESTLVCLVVIWKDALTFLSCLDGFELMKRGPNDLSWDLCVGIPRRWIQDSKQKLVLKNLGGCTLEVMLSDKALQEAFSQSTIIFTIHVCTCPEGHCTCLCTVTAHLLIWNKGDANACWSTWGGLATSWIL